MCLCLVLTLLVGMVLVPLSLHASTTVLFTGKVLDKVFGREYETSYLKGLRHGPYVIIHRNGVTAAQGIYRQGKRVKHREWDTEGGQIELEGWNFDGTPKKHAPKNLN